MTNLNILLIQEFRKSAKSEGHLQERLERLTLEIASLKREIIDMQAKRK